ncbi:DUF881 domain-containing protein [Cellulomonas fengjieae]|uniref:DUF881 domain-containing protein n=1 Tax=Cellulomonas fengjieae TaxID=2819978 RepID=A0ABS3SHY7_9CELL|nr:DUF881 domain-containing protein [Cellulomonas fengjieae]MBO3085360.1 DUF881 domain-containing protein [Cellulomonas fengjieae]MBO3101105.1 DUF881 domain-containing protein [Cellulomonas fengjieae]QVI66086.1 DUF881 domain-containing protein [Cellulomonas fengjieae]
MTDHPHRVRRRVARGTLSVALVLALSGALFAANAKFARASGERHPQDLRDLARVETGRVERLATEVDSLRAHVDSLTSTANEAAGTSVGTPSPAYVVEGGLVPVTGPGLTVRLDDAPTDSPRREEVSADVLVVHQQDLQAVMNALWAGGAEAMELMDQRVISTSAFMCAGNVLKLHGRLYSPPYVVTAIGNPEDLRRALLASSAVQSYVRDAADVGLGWSVTDADEPLVLDAYSGATELSAATVPDGVEILPGLERAEAESEDRTPPAGMDPDGTG